MKQHIYYDGEDEFLVYQYSYLGMQAHVILAHDPYMLQGNPTAYSDLSNWWETLKEAVDEHLAELKAREENINARRKVEQERWEKQFGPPAVPMMRVVHGESVIDL